MKYFKLKKQADFNKLFKSGKRLFSSSLTVIYAPAEKTTMGISVGKKHGKSVQRNRIKRLIREAFRSVQPQLKKQYSFVLIPKVLQEYSFEVFKRHLECMIQKRNL